MPGSAPRATLNNPYGPMVTFRTEDVLPPSALYISMNDTMLGMLFVSQPYAQFTLTTRLLMPDGTLQVDVYRSIVTENALTPFIVVPPVEGYLLGAVAELNTVPVASAWCVVTLLRGTIVDPVLLTPPGGGTLVMQGYVDIQSYLSWPNSPCIEAGTGAGRIRVITPAVSVGTNWSLTAASYQRLEIISVHMVLTTSGTAGNRVASLVVQDNYPNIGGIFPANFTQAPSLAYNYSFYESAGEISVGPPWVTAPIPAGLTLDPGMTLRSNVSGLDAADVWSNVVINAKEYMGVGHL